MTPVMVFRPLFIHSVRSFMKAQLLSISMKLTSVDFRAEGMKDPWESFDKAGDPDSFEFAIPSPTAQEMLAFCGGSVSGGKWNAPIDIPNIRKSFKIQTTPYKGKYTEYTFAICKVSARLSQAPSSEQTDLLLVKCTRLAAITSAGQQRSSFGRAVMNVTLTPVTAVAITRYTQSW